MNTKSEILFERVGCAGVITLNRPKALNALTHDMVQRLKVQIDEWKTDNAVTRIILRANGERAFCAGGDLRGVTQPGKQKEALEFFRDEYLLNATIKRYPKPYISLIDGIVMGGGFGISVHGSHRIAGEKLQFAMPEVGIGYFPDVGGTYVLPRLRGKIGTFCALTGARLNFADAIHAGICTHHIPAARFAELLSALSKDEPIDDVMADFAAPILGDEVKARQPLIDRVFAAGTVEMILDRLDHEEGEDSDWASKIAASIRVKSPTSLKIALEQMQRGSQWTFEECMRAEFRIASRVVYEHDFHEGVRAVIIDKDNAPKWNPASLSDMTAERVDRYFAPLPRELPL